MCILHSVGLKGTNNLADVRVVQALLNENVGRLTPFSPLVIDGRAGLQTRNMIREFQSRVMKKDNPDSRVDPNGSTLRELRAGLSAGLTQNKLLGIMTFATKARVDLFLPPLLTKMLANQINSSLRIAHFLAQLGHESGDLKFTEEIASGRKYEGRRDLGNTQPGDGPKFKGRGLIQLTGRANYTAFGLARTKDFVTGDNPRQLASDSTLAVDVSCFFWTTRGLNTLADADNVTAITKRVNGGFNGLADRKAHLRRAKCLLP